MPRFANRNGLTPFTVFGPVIGSVTFKNTGADGLTDWKASDGIVGLRVLGVVLATSASDAMRQARGPLNPSPIVCEGAAS